MPTVVNSGSILPLVRLFPAVEYRKDSLPFARIHLGPVSNGIFFRILGWEMVERICKRDRGRLGRSCEEDSAEALFPLVMHKKPPSNYMDLPISCCRSAYTLSIEILGCVLKIVGEHHDKDRSSSGRVSSKRSW